MNRLRLFLTGFLLTATIAHPAVVAGQTSTYKLVATPTSLAPGKPATFELQGEPTITDFTLVADPSTGLTCNSAMKKCTAPAAPGAGLAVVGEVKVTAQSSSGKDLASITISLVPDSDARGPWEGRAIIGYHQAGAAAADFAQDVMIDLYVVRPMHRDKQPWNARWNTWGNVRIASAPQQLNTPFVSLLQGLLVGGDNSPLNTKVNELARSGEFQSGIEFNLSPSENGRVHGVVAFFGATGAFQAPRQSVSIFAVPAAASPQLAVFKQRFPSVSSTYIGFANPDRDRFYRQWGAGYRYAKYGSGPASRESPQTFTFTLGQDEAVTGGRLESVVARFDGFYPLPIGKQSNGRWQFLYVFGTATLRLSAGEERPPMVLQPAPAAVNGYDPTVTIVGTPSNRDTYRVGIGADLINLIRSVPKR